MLNVTSTEVYLKEGWSSSESIGLAVQIYQVAFYLCPDAMGKSFNICDLVCRICKILALFICSAVFEGEQGLPNTLKYTTQQQIHCVFEECPKQLHYTSGIAVSSEEKKRKPLQNE